MLGRVIIAGIRIGGLPVNPARLLCVLDRIRRIGCVKQYDTTINNNPVNTCQEYGSVDSNLAGHW